MLTGTAEPDRREARGTKGNVQKKAVSCNVRETFVVTPVKAPKPELAAETTTHA